MRPRRSRWQSILALLLARRNGRGKTPLAAAALPWPEDMQSRTLYLRADQPRAMAELNRQLRSPGASGDVLAPGVEVISWYVLMGIGQIVTLRLKRPSPHGLMPLSEANRGPLFRTDACEAFDFGALYAQMQGRG